MYTHTEDAFHPAIVYVSPGLTVLTGSSAPNLRANLLCCKCWTPGAVKLRQCTARVCVGVQRCSSALIHPVWLLSSRHLSSLAGRHHRCFPSVISEPRRKDARWVRSGRGASLQPLPAQPYRLGRGHTAMSGTSHWYAPTTAASHEYAQLPAVLVALAAVVFTASTMGLFSRRWSAKGKVGLPGLRFGLAGGSVAAIRERVWKAGAIRELTRWTAPSPYYAAHFHHRRLAGAWPGAGQARGGAGC